MSRECRMITAREQYNYVFILIYHANTQRKIKWKREKKRLVFHSRAARISGLWLRRRLELLTEWFAFPRSPRRRLRKVSVKFRGAIVRITCAECGLVTAAAVAGTPKICVIWASPKKVRGEKANWFPSAAAGYHFPRNDKNRRRSHIVELGTSHWSSRVFENELSANGSKLSNWLSDMWD